jgi:Cu(I)/Ag(I) efflux system membrane fusion protein
MADEIKLQETQPTTSDASHWQTTTIGRRILVAARVIQIRLRFVAVLVVAFLIVGMWGNLRNVWDTLSHRLAGWHAPQHAVSIDTEYYCPMCPGVVSDWPAICPVCNMDLVRHKKGEAVVLPEGLVARMQFSPYRIQLAGIKTSAVRRQLLAREIVLTGRLIDLATSARVEPRESPAAATVPRNSDFVVECEVYPGDLGLLTAGRMVEVTIEGLAGVKPLAGRIIAGQADGAPARSAPAVLIRLEGSPVPLHAGMYAAVRVAVPITEIEPFASMPGPSTAGESRDFVAVPETAVVDAEARRVVFIETMPGMFDGVEVTLGPRCGDYFPVLAGLEPGQRVATVGAFLIDAEARRNRNVADSYFGAARSSGSEAAGGSAAAADSEPTEKPKSKKSAAVKLPDADQQLVKKQKVCPVTGAPLDSMGGPIAVEVQGRRIFICCKACEAPLKKDPQKYLAKLNRD